MQFTLTMPEWTAAEMAKLPPYLITIEDRMAAVIQFARLNAAKNTGGPFAAGVFEEESGRPIVIGVNRVLPHNCSSAHAEIMALSLAQQILGTYDLGGPGLPRHQFVVNWRPCAMCYGAVVWSGIRTLVVAGDGPELEAITGFDEGPVHPNWLEELNKRDIEVVNNVLRDEAIAGFEAFRQSRNFVYNSRLGEETTP